MLASLKFNGIHELCRVKLIQTEFPSLYIIEEKEDFLRRRDIFPDLLTYINSKFVYVEGKTRGQMNDLYIDILNKKCESDISILKESLSLAHLAPDSFAFNLMGPGYMAHLSGELVHIVKCLPVEVNVRENLDICYLQIPVKHNNKNMFLSHRTKILLKQSTETKCNKLLRIGFKINNKWYTFTPKLKEIEEPEILSPDTHQTWESAEIKHLATDGIYTKEEMQDYMSKISFPLERPTIVDNTIIKIHQEEEERRSKRYTWNPFKIGFWRALASSYWRDFKDFGQVSAGILMICFIIYVTVQVINVVIRGLTIHKTFRFSAKLLAALLGSLTNLFIYLSQLNNEPKTNQINLESMKPSKKFQNKSQIPIATFRQNHSIPRTSLTEEMNDIHLYTKIPKPYPRNNFTTSTNEIPQTLVITADIQERYPRTIDARHITEFDHISY